MTTPPPKRSKLKRAILWLVGIAVFIELLLQIAAYVAWTQRRSGETRSEGDGPVVLCVGDSMSYGLGSTQGGSYPAQLEKKLRERSGRDWVVVNGAYPGRNSHDVLGLLPDQLARFAPDYVMVLVGTNDQWARPGELTQANAESFPIVWRTKRMIDILLVGRLAEHGEEGFVGIWNKDGSEVHFQPTGRMLYANAELRWETRDGKLIVVLPSQEEVEVEWRLDDDKLCLRSKIWEEEQVLAPGPVTDLSALQRGQRELGAQQYDAAITELTAALEEPSAIGPASEGLIRAHLAKRDEASARARLGTLRTAYRDAPDQAKGEALAHSLLMLDEIDESVEVAAAVSRAFPENVRAWEVLIRHGLPNGKADILVAAIDDTVPKLPKGSLRADLLLQRALTRKDAGDSQDFVRNLIQSWRSGTLDEHVVNHVHLAKAAIDNATVDAMLGELGADDGESKRFRDLVARGRAGGGVANVVAKHLDTIIETCRASGAEPILLDYPFRDLDHEKLVDGVATAKKARRVALRPRFDELLETMGRDELFIRDDVHCNDRGYGVMADLVAEALLQ